MIRLLVALPAEAKPLVRLFELQRLHDCKEYPVYRSERIALIVSGPGADASAAATKYLHAHSPEVRYSPWLNIGIAGHRTHRLGSAYLIQKITDKATGKSFYPPQLLSVSVPRESVVTVQAPEQDYPDAALVDMEASAFYATAARFSTGELVQCLKIISDNYNSPARNITAKQVEQLIYEKGEVIETIINALESLCSTLQTNKIFPDELERFREQWRFTVTQDHQLQDLLRRSHALGIGQELWCNSVCNAKTARDVLHQLRSKITATPVRIT